MPVVSEKLYASISKAWTIQKHRENWGSKICALMGYYATLSASSLPTFRDNLLVPSSRVKKVWTSWPLKMKPRGCTETSVKDYYSALRNIPEERRSHQHRGGSLKSWWQAPPKRRPMYTSLQCITQKTWIFINTAVRTSNLARDFLVLSADSTV